MEAIVVCKNENFMLTILQIVILCLKNFDGSQKLTIMGLISSLYNYHFSRKEQYWVLLAKINFNIYSIWTSFGS